MQIIDRPGRHHFWLRLAVHGGADQTIEITTSTWPGGDATTADLDTYEAVMLADALVALIDETLPHRWRHLLLSRLAPFVVMLGILAVSLRAGMPAFLLGAEATLAGIVGFSLAQVAYQAIRHTLDSRS